jgi:hypothetical protein
MNILAHYCKLVRKLLDVLAKRKKIAMTIRKKKEKWKRGERNNNNTNGCNNKVLNR